MLLAGCVGSEGPIAGGTSGDTDPERVTFEDSETRTVFPEGSAAFTVSPALAATEQAVCAVNDVTASTCMTDADSGEISFVELGPGAHQLSVEIRSSDGSDAVRVVHPLEVATVDVVVYGATPGGISAAIAAARASQSVVILEPTRWIGGTMSGGLARTDVGARGEEIIGGLAADFFERIRVAEHARGACPGQQRCRGLHRLEPRVAAQVFEEMISESRVIVERSARLTDVVKEDATIQSVTTTRGEIAGQIFIDGSYEGDLMAMAGIAYRIGREPRQLADPPDDAIQLSIQEDDAGATRYRVPLTLFVDPYRVPGDPSSGTLPFVEPRPADLPEEGEGDSRVMAYTYRLCVTDDPSNRIPFERPENYDPARYEASARVAQANVEQKNVDLAEVMFNPAVTLLSGNREFSKYDLNGGSTFSSDMTAPDLNQSYVEADEAERERIRAAYREYIRGLLYFWRTDPRFGALNEKVDRFGYCADEFLDSGGWPHQLYVREARRMVGEYVLNENDVLQNGRRQSVPDPVGFGAYSMDTHTVRYLAAPVRWPDGITRDALVVEGFWLVRLPDSEPYPVPYRALVPRAEDATNLLSPVTLSATHMAYSSLRMEPTFMILGEAAGTAAALAIELQQGVQSVDYGMLRQRLLANGARLVN